MYLSGASLVALLLSSITPISALPSPAPETDTLAPAPFTTFTAWIDGIIANPNGTHLTPDEAFDAATSTSTLRLEKRVFCDPDPTHFKRAPGRGAAWCLDYLARQHAAGIRCGLPAETFLREYCRHQNAIIQVSKASTKSESISCGDVARNEGSIFDSCWRADDTVVGQEIKYGNTNIAVTIRGA